jgi:hypothetical protein
MEKKNSLLNAIIGIIYLFNKLTQPRVINFINK